jgi:hypothetical protein
MGFPFFVKLTMLPIPPTNLFFVRHVAPYFPTVSYPLLLKGLKSHVVTLQSNLLNEDVIGTMPALNFPS